MLLFGFASASASASVARKAGLKGLEEDISRPASWK